MGRTKTVNVEDQIARAVLKIAARDGGVDGITAAAVAKMAKVSVKDVQAALARGPGSPAFCEQTGYVAFLPVLTSWVTAQAAEREGEEDGTARDQLFEIMMARVDVLQADRSGFIPIARAVMQDPRAWPSWGLAVGPALGKASPNAADHESKRLLENLGILIVYILTLRKWLSDETPDLGPTMAELDRRLTQAERLWSWAT